MANNQFKRGELYSVITGMANTAIARRLQKNFRQAGVELTVEQWSVLVHLWKEDGLSQQELCNRTFRDKPSITRLLHNMEKQGLVQRVSSKTDRRINKIQLTEAARSMKDQSTEIANDTLNDGLEGVTKEEVEVVKKVLQQVYDNLK
ncbi:MAG: MarR family transcriptional regulator [Bacteroidota bacterium]